MEHGPFDVAALGELLVDFTAAGESGQGNPLFEANPGGAPCNVLAMLAILGRRCAFVGKVGRDMFGAMLRRAGEEAGICMDGLGTDGAVNTTLAFVRNAPGGERDFSFYRRPGADLMLTAEEIPGEMVASARIFHFGSLSLTGEPARSATRHAVALAREGGALLSFDPNLRPPLWEDLEDARAQIGWGLSQCDAAKLSDEELAFVTGEEDLERGLDALLARYPNLRLVSATAGAKGSLTRLGDLRIAQNALLLGGTVDTTGAGDTFWACVLDAILTHGLEGLGRAELEEALRFASAAAYLVTTRKGALRAMPTRPQVEALLG